MASEWTVITATRLSRSRLAIVLWTFRIVKMERFLRTASLEAKADFADSDGGDLGDNKEGLDVGLEPGENVLGVLPLGSETIQVGVCGMLCVPESACGSPPYI